MLFVALNSLQKPCHISPKSTHDLHPFKILLDLLRCVAMNTIPVERGDGDHLCQVKEIIELMEGIHPAGAAQGSDSNADLKAKIRATGRKYRSNKPENR